MMDVKSILQSHRGVCFVKDADFKYYAMSPKLIEYAGYSKCPEKICDLKDDEFLWAEYTNEYRDEDRLVLKGEGRDSLQKMTVKGDYSVFIVCRRSPIYKDETVVGVFGETTIVENLGMSELLNEKNFLKEYGGSPSNYKFEFKYKNLTRKQSIVFFHYLRGRTCKAIAKIMNLNYRTVESHIDAIKIRLNASTRSDLFEYAYNNGCLKIIPYDFI